MTTAETLERGRAAFEVSAWVEAYDCLAAADAEESLAPADIELFATAAFLIGRDDESSALCARAHRARRWQSAATRIATGWTASGGVRAGEPPDGAAAGSRPTGPAAVALEDGR
jgi:hypothetical protein